MAELTGRDARSPDGLVGLPIDAVPTPALLLDLEAFGRNAVRIAEDLAAAGVAWRPHAKAHVNADLVRRQIAAGAIGATCATVAEGEVLVDGGVESVLIANEVPSPDKAVRVARLNRGATVMCCVDSDEGVAVMQQAAEREGVTIALLIEVDIGMQRAGVAPGSDVVRLGRAIAAAGASLRLVGVMGYEGHVLDMQPVNAKASAVRKALARLIEARDQLVAAGLPVPIVSCGGTGSYRLSAAVPGITEIQAGGGCLNDRFYTEACGVTWLEQALTVHAAVTSRPRRDIAIVDAGFKAMSIADGPPLPRVPGARVAELYAEHGKLALEDGATGMKIGDRVVFTPGYSDSTTLLHAALLGVAGGRVEAVLRRPVRWPG